MHLACTRYLTCLHTGDRSAEAIDAGVLPGYQGVIVRDGYAGVRAPDQRLARLVRCPPAQGPQKPYDFEPFQQQWSARRPPC